MSAYQSAESRSDAGDQPNPEAATINPLNVIRILRSAGSALFAQAALHGQLARIEWAEEKARLLKLLVTAMLGMACLLCAMLFVGVLVLAVSWETDYRIHAVVALIAFYGVGIVVAVHCMQTLAALGERSFAATREELAADIELIRSQL